MYFPLGIFDSDNEYSEPSLTRSTTSITRSSTRPQTPPTPTPRHLPPTYVPVPQALQCRAPPSAPPTVGTASSHLMPIPTLRLLLGASHESAPTLPTRPPAPPIPTPRRNAVISITPSTPHPPSYICAISSGPTVSSLSAGSTSCRPAFIPRAADADAAHADC